MGRKTNALLGFLLALTCVSRGRPYADRSDTDPSTVFPSHFDDDPVFASNWDGVEEKKTAGKEKRNAKYSRHKRTEERRKSMRLSSIYNSDYHAVTYPTGDESSGPPLEDVSLTPPAAPNPTSLQTAAPLKGILRHGPPTGPRPAKKVRFNRRPVIYFYDPYRNDGLEKCGGDGPGTCQPQYRFTGPMKPTRYLKTGLRHLFYQ
jgi:hypothetical protein